MNAKILNRSTAPPEDGWYQIEVTGLHAAGPKRQQLIDEQAMETIVTRFQSEREAEGDSWMGMLVDIDHHSHDLSKTTEAWAWLQDLDIRDGQLHGKLDLTDLGEAAILNKRVKRFSTEYDPADTEEVEPGIVRPLRLAGLAFTNRPNNRGGKPISNRAEPAADDETTNNNMKDIAEKLGLPADADEAAILAKLTDIMSELDTMKGKEAEAEVTEIMNRFTDRIPTEKVADVKERLIKNRADTVAMLELLPAKVEEKKAPLRIFNREGQPSPDPVESGNADEEEKEAKRMALVETIRNRDKVTHDRAWQTARRQSPELFG